MKVVLLLLVVIDCHGSNVDLQSQEMIAARCYSKCLHIFIRYKSSLSEKLSKSGTGQSSISPVNNEGMLQLAFVDEIAQQLSVTQLSLQSCLEDPHNQCSRQCFKTCTSMNECICQQNDIGCLMACNHRKELSRETNQDDCPFISNLEDTSFKILHSKCPNTCRSKLDCNASQLCCSTESCGPICLQIDNRKVNLPKYTPVPTKSSTQSNIEFDWSHTFSPYLKNESPLVFILQTRTCLCKKIVNKYLNSWQTLLMTHLLGAKLNALDNGTIYQFRLAAVSLLGSNGFGLMSENLPSIISKPLPPFPPENFLEYKWQITDENLFKVEIKWDDPKSSLWRNYEYLLSWMVDHGVIQFGGEPLSSLTQFTKALPGSNHQSTIDNLRPSTTYKIQIVTKVDWPGFGDILSEPSTMFVTTPATSTIDQALEGLNINSESKSCSCPNIKFDQSYIKLRSPIFISGDLQLTIDIKNEADYMIDLYAEACINYFNENNSLRMNRFRRLYKQTSEIILENLQFNCRYILEISKTSKTSSASTHQFCFCTPPCHKTYHGKNCQNEDKSIFPSPREVKISLFNFDTMTYKVSWEAMNDNLLKRSGLPSITRYRVIWAPRKFEPVPIDHYNGIIGFDPIFDLDRSDVRIIQSNITRLLLHNLTKDQLYIVRVQSLATLENGQLLESHPITLFLPTHGYSEFYYHNSQSHLLPIKPFIIIIMMLFYPSFILLQSS